MKFLKFIFLSFCIMVFINALATPDPLALLKSVSDDLLTSLERERPKTKTSNKWIYRIIDRIILPHVDTAGMSRSVLGRNAWTKANSSQRKAFINEFTDVVIRTYSSALDAYTDETIRFFPLRGGYENKRRIMVHSQVIRKDGPPIPLDYRMILMRDKWKIYDLNVEGVSLLQSFHSQFSDELSKGKTIDQIIQDLKERNRGKK